ncbi:MAG: bifunctional phosphopantothenoylcysteine decarboxylase/phosphopantothenate--cysteine ligase CoaBC [Desulfuromonadales bacterium]|nr:bifunctional phosphopantothenoylcysteine decarboxylase/phosphopantothenate--cysteine ligase CoaBC [Desulfuromonadales bacterium]
MSLFREKQIVLGVSGGIAAYKAAELLRLLVKAGASVQVIMTRAAREFVAPLTFQTLSGHPVHTELFNLIQEQEIGHISLADRADLLLVAPATAHLVGRVANGLADDLLTTTIMATRAPVLLVPAMNSNMWHNPLYQQNQQRLVDAGYQVMPPAHGDLACGWQGEGKMPEPAEILDYAAPLLGDRALAGKTVLVTAGPTREELDPVRYLTNYSSGRMGYAVARAARNRGARTILVTGPVSLAAPQRIETIAVNTAVEMQQAVLAHADQADIIIKSAAVADFRPAERAAEKVKKAGRPSLQLDLEKNPDILAELGQRKRAGQILVGFAAETTDVVAQARQKLVGKGLDLVVANDVTEPGAGFDVETNVVRLIFADGRIEALPKLPKEAVADVLLQALVDLTGQTGSGSGE